MLTNTVNILANFNIPILNKSSRITNLEKYLASDLGASSQVEYLLKKYCLTTEYLGSIPFNWIKNVEKTDERK